MSSIADIVQPFVQNIEKLTLRNSEQFKMIADLIDTAKQQQGAINELSQICDRQQKNIELLTTHVIKENVGNCFKASREQNGKSSSKVDTKDEDAVPELISDSESDSESEDKDTMPELVETKSNKPVEVIDLETKMKQICNKITFTIEIKYDEADTEFIYICRPSIHAHNYLIIKYLIIKYFNLEEIVEDYDECYSYDEINKYFNTDDNVFKFILESKMFHSKFLPLFSYETQTLMLGDPLDIFKLVKPIDISYVENSYNYKIKYMELPVFAENYFKQKLSVKETSIEITGCRYTTYTVEHKYLVDGMKIMNIDTDQLLKYLNNY